MFKEILTEAAKFHSVYIKGTKKDAQDLIVAMFAMGITGAYDSTTDHQSPEYFSIYRKGPGGMGVRNAKKIAQIARRRGFNGFITDDQYARGPADAIATF